MNDRIRSWLVSALGLDARETPFPWQERLLGALLEGRVERTIDLPTGLGKTAVMAIWLVARAAGARVPRRLVYVVDRRAVVDQATRVAEALREFVAREPELRAALGLERPLPISTLRGQFADNREWMDDPTAPAIILGTVDMVGSRLLFGGYGTSPKMRPFQAGLLGSDTLVVLDEAHLVPPFEALLSTIVNERHAFGPAAEDLARLVPTLELMCLSATRRTAGGTVFTLDERDRKHPEVKRRLGAKKVLTVKPLPQGTKLAEALAQEAWRLAEAGRRPIRCLVFTHLREDAERARSALDTLAGGQAELELFVGGRRVSERQAAAERLAALGYLAGSDVTRERPAFLLATSAAEVGVDLDADHLVCDLVTWERMVQRLGRVNRRGRGDAQVVVVDDPEAVKALEQRLGREGVLRAPLEHLPSLASGGVDASPAALARLSALAATDDALRQVLSNATTPPPLRPPLTRPTLDAWAMTSLDEHPGRPEVGPWLRGWVDDEPQTRVVWRRHVGPPSKASTPSRRELDTYFEATPPHLSEVLEAPTHRVVDWLEKRARAVLSGEGSDGAMAAEGATGLDESAPPLAAQELACVWLRDDGRVADWRKLEDFAAHPTEKWRNKKAHEELFRQLSGGTLVVDARLGGLGEAGLLNETCTTVPATADGGTGDSVQQAFPTGFRVSRTDSAARRSDGVWHERLRLPCGHTPEGEVDEWLLVEKLHTTAANEEDRSAGPPQLLDEHQAWTEAEARVLAQALQLPEHYEAMLAMAARLHDEGKRAKSWQRAFHAPADGTYAKTEGPIDLGLLARYRHELGSLPRAEADAQLAALPEDLRDLALHLIAAHHGAARPWIETRGFEAEPPSRVAERAQDIALRFSRLQRRWGPWGLAWWEALLRSADQRASRANEARGNTGASQKEVP